MINFMDVTAAWWLAWWLFWGVIGAVTKLDLSLFLPSAWPEGERSAWVAVGMVVWVIISIVVTPDE